MASYLDEKTLLSLSDIDPELQAVSITLRVFYRDLTSSVVFREN